MTSFQLPQWIPSPEIQENFDALALAIGDRPILTTGTVLQLLTTGTTRRLAFGSSTFDWPGGAQSVAGKTIAHGLGVAPVWFMVQTVDDGPWCAAQLGSPSSTNLVYDVHTTDGTSPAAPSTTTVRWAAIG